MGKFLRIALLFTSLLVCAGAMAQTPGTAIKGTVSDDQGATLPGVTVKVKGTSVGVITDVNGNYNIQVPQGGKTLVFSFIGMQTQEISIGSKAIIDVRLSLSSTALTDVVVIGYGTQKRQDVNGAISSVSAKDIQDIPQPSIDQMLQGKAAGVTVTNNSGQPGSATSIHIRGITNFGINGTTSEPLYVIDGVAIEGNSQAGVQLTRPGGG